jgi:hypothetical protein
LKRIGEYTVNTPLGKLKRSASGLIHCFLQCRKHHYSPSIGRQAQHASSSADDILEMLETIVSHETDSPQVADIMRRFTAPVLPGDSVCSAACAHGRFVRYCHSLISTCPLSAGIVQRACQQYDGSTRCAQGGLYGRVLVVSMFSAACASLYWAKKECANAL